MLLGVYRRDSIALLISEAPMLLAFRHSPLPSAPGSRGSRRLKTMIPPARSVDRRRPLIPTRSNAGRYLPQAATGCGRGLPHGVGQGRWPPPNPQKECALGWVNIVCSHLSCS